MATAKKKDVKGAEIDVTSVTGKNRSIDVLYVRLLNDKVHRTYEVVEDEMLLDCNKDGEFVGVEILLPETKRSAGKRPAKRRSAKKRPAKRRSAKRRPAKKARAKGKPKAGKSAPRAKARRPRKK